MSYKAQDSGQHATHKFLITGPRCGGCVAKVEKAVTSLNEVSEASFNLSQATLTVTGKVDDEAIIAAIAALDYSAQRIQSVTQAEEERESIVQQQYAAHRRHALIGLGLGLPLMIYGLLFGMAVDSTQAQLGWSVVSLLTAMVLYRAGGHFFRNALQQLRSGSTSMDTLIALGTSSAWLYSSLIVLSPESFPVAARHVYFEAAAMIIGLINLGQALELRARGQTSAALKKLIGIQPKTACVIEADKSYDRPIDQLAINDEIRARSGEQIAVDGIVIAGHGHIDQAMLTGEAIPVACQQGDTVNAGTVLLDGTLLYRASRVGRDTALARIINMVQRAQGSKLPIGRLADRVASIFVPCILFVALLSAAAWWFWGPEPRLMYMVISAVTVLIIACPCALGLATPMSIMSGVGVAAEHGILVRQGEALQQAAKIDTVILDKTGTITCGRPTISDVVTLDYDRDTLLLIAASLEQGSSHPIAKAIISSHKNKMLEFDDFHSIAGMGISARTAYGFCLLGNQQLLKSHQVETSPLAEASERLQEQGNSIVLLAIDGKLAGLIALKDEVKMESKAAIASLQQRGIEVIMASGDNNTTCCRVAAEVGISQFHGSLSPREKLALVEQLQQQQRVVAMVGDGINDAPALAQADVGYAIGEGSDIAIESGDITLLNHSLKSIENSIIVSQATLSNIKQNLFGAFIYNSIGIPIAAGILYPSLGLLLNPVIAGAAMSLSSLTVVLNANRLRRLKITP
ncbi:Cu+-exporting ATPase [Sinobacterium caligoides]|uniref:Copper-exporting P-type ATPase n=1 Tax=Sinobacterium caligoides TaxID=933926 RepID=A0A3N2DGQ5_9GAMM|nr:heavy metal translocating P-type ATPase [Sinobacterium caligoides]ROR98939.1 Cu+-exporting ATPase [Sinobacterium caligoides]